MAAPGHIQDWPRRSSRPDRAPILLLADSRLLFAHEDDGAPLVRRLCDRYAGSAPRAAYIGASNGDRPEFYEIFEGAMDLAGVGSRRMVRATWSDDDRRWLDAASLVVLAGGDVELGWRTLRSTGIGDAVVARYLGGALVIGVSAGAVQLGLRAWCSTGAGDAPLDTFGLVPYVVDVHDEDTGWARLKRLLLRGDGARHGLGIPRGGGVLYHPDRPVEPLGARVLELAMAGASLTEALLDPDR